MEIRTMLQRLTEAKSVSGCETCSGGIAETAAELLRPFCDTVEIVSGNVIGTRGARTPDQPHIMLDAHMDQVGFYVTKLLDNGFVRVGNVGGIDHRQLLDQRVHLHGKTTISGVVCCMPPHLQKDSARVLNIDEIAIDTGYSKEELEEILAPGDSVTFDMPLVEMQNGTVSGASLDDRCGIAAIVQALEYVKGESLPCSVSVLFSTQEEVGERGAKTGVFHIAPDIAIAVDVTFAKGHGEDSPSYGRLENGPMIGIAPALSRELSQQLADCAKNANIPYRMEVMTGATGTNADQFSVFAGGVVTGTVSIPLRYMHTPVEVISISDVENTAKLLSEYLRTGAK